MRAFLAIIIICAQAFAAELIPEDRTALIPREKALQFVHAFCLHVPEGIIAFWTPAAVDLRDVESSLLPFLQKVRPEFAIWFSGGPDSGPRWSWVRRQAVGVQRGDVRFLLIAYHCELPAETAQRENEVKAKMGDQYRPDGWKQRPLTAHGGGPSYFRVLFDTKKREFTWYEENLPE